MCETVLGNRKEIEEQTTTWDKTVIDRTGDLKNWVEVFKSLVSNTKVLKIFAFSNNRYALCRRRHNRHTFAVRRLISWYREGKDIQRLLPHLSTYLGHVDIDSTAHYLTMTRELLQEANHCFEIYASGEVRHG
jgi:hypothetical protein